ncbi:GNAT family N-acetyltransferase [Sphingomonas montana]|uniref:GNAT family N-acetyltransferase n=1 Tax=Sphingomonas montana TaxID=1843236 RepID=UPI001F0AB574|nr:GNAT family protein [Sphingomonas montana]
MAGDVARLVASIDAPGLHLEQLGDAHRERLGALCPADDPVWEIYPTSYAPDRFDASFAAMRADPNRRPFALFACGVMVGMSGYLNIDPTNRVVEIGGTYLTPAARGTGLNRSIKLLLIDRAIDAGFDRIEFRIDVRNGRSIAAVEKLGAVREGVLRRQRVTWTGHVRDTVVYSILANEWLPK